MKPSFKHFSRIFSVLALCFSVAVLTSCDTVIGYSILLWNDPEHNLADGTVLPVYVKSNISKVYVAGLPDSKKEKIEVPLWKMSEPMSKKKTYAKLAKYEEYSHKYAKCVLDGLPIRSETVNTSKQVYRLRKDEIIRVLYEKQGQAVTTGKTNLEGAWLRVLTSSGVEGWCFSHNLRLFEINADGSYGEGAEEAQVQEKDVALENMLAARWYPEYYYSMIKSNQIDLDYMKNAYGLDTGSTTGVVALHMDGIDAEYPFSGVTKISGSTYRFNETSIQFTIRGNSSISVQYTDASGMPTTYAMISLPDANIGDLIAEEKKNRQNLYNSILSTGPVFSSSNYGTLTFKAENAFTWTDYDLLVPSVISKDAAGSGTVSLKYFLPSAYKTQWDGILTFAFDGMTREVSFLYKSEANGIRLSTVNISIQQTNRTLLPSVTVAQPVNATVIFLQN